MERTRLFARDTLIGTIVGLLIVTVAIFAFLVFWEIRGNGSMDIGSGLFALCRISARVLGSSYVIEPRLGILVYALLFGLGNAIVGQGVRFLVQRV